MSPDNLFLLGGIKMVERTSSPFWFSPYTGLIRLMCSFKGWPRPRVVWYNPDGKLITGESESLSVYETLWRDRNILSLFYSYPRKRQRSL